MRIGALTVPLHDRSLEAAAGYLADVGAEAVELGCGGNPGDDHLPRDEYLDDPDRQGDLHDLLTMHNLAISALATHNNPLHPDETTRKQADSELREAIILASQLGIDTVTCFSGLPGGAPEDTTPNWVTAPWPPVHQEILRYQWDTAIEYWTDLATHADDHNVNVAIEMHPNMLIYEPTGLLHLREHTNHRIGANFDPSHLYWQGMEIPTVIRLLADHDAIHHVHAKDTGFYPTNIRRKGVLDTAPFDEAVDRSWLFRTIGYGHDEGHWKDVISSLRLVGYDGTISIEHEDILLGSEEGLEKAINFLRRIRFETDPADIFWAD